MLAFGSVQSNVSGSSGPLQHEHSCGVAGGAGIVCLGELAERRDDAMREFVDTLNAGERQRLEGYEHLRAELSRSRMNRAAERTETDRWPERERGPERDA